MTLHEHLHRCTEDELADLVVDILNCRFGGGADFHEAFADVFDDVDAACAKFRARNDHSDAPCMYDMGRHPDDPFYGSRLSVFGRA